MTGTDDERQQRRGDDAADDRAAHRRLLLRAFAQAERERQHAEDHCCEKSMGSPLSRE
jgi:hypothetical protein